MGNIIPQENEGLESEQSLFGRFAAWLRGPWLDLGKWNGENKTKIRNSIINIKQRTGIDFVNCLLIGQISSGKTSFVNSAVTALADEGRRKNPFTVYTRGNDSTTKILRLCPFFGNNGEEIGLRFYDCRGLHDINSLLFEDILKIINGHILPGYKFDPNTPISEEHEMYRSDPELADKIHCVVYVIDSTAPKDVLTTKTAEETFEKLRSVLSDSDVPQLVLMTKADLIHKHFQENLENLMYSNHMKVIRNRVAKFTKLTKNRILLQANYFDEMSTSFRKDFLTLYNLQKIVESADDYFQFVERIG